jgi:alginate O-acetyltransferase complex protein AlgI
MWNIDWNRIPELLLYHAQQPLLFNSGLFLYLFLGFALGYRLLLRTNTLRILYVTLFSYYFYYKCSGPYFYLLGVVTLCDYLTALLIHHSRRQWIRRFWLCASLLVNLGLLAYFKYTNFLYEAFAPLWNGEFKALDIFLPVGISFFTFQSLSYTIDVYRRQLTPLRNPLDYAFFVSFFPTLVAGPIIRASEFIPQIRRPLLVTNVMFGTGLFFIISGLFKKAVLSDYISINYVERIFDNPALYSGLENLLGIYGYALQIYCDFSGYSDMAIGIALLLGFHFPANFRSPYKASSITDFWRRWHISLSSWLRDYLYISLGGNRKGKVRTYLNLFLTMLLGGLWHGASWNFILWGALHGGALALHKAWRSFIGHDKTYKSHGILKWGGTILTFHFVCFCWLFFRNRTLEASFTMLKKIFTDFHPELFTQLLTAYPAVWSMMGIGFLLHFLPDKWSDHCQQGVSKLPLIGQALLLTTMIYVVIQVKGSEVQPFIYFQF